MSYLNKVSLIGNVGQDPDIKKFDNGGKVASFSLATSKSYKQHNGEKKTTTEWHRIVVKNQNIIEHIIEKGYIKKGMKLYLEGEISTREYQDKQVNTKITEIIVSLNHTILLLTSQEKIQLNSNNQNENIEDIDIPF